MDHKPIVLTDEDRRVIAEVTTQYDPVEGAVWRDLTASQRVGIALAMSDLERRVGIWSVQQEFPDLDEAAAQRLFLKRFYASKKFTRTGMGVVFSEEWHELRGKHPELNSI